MQLLEMVKEWLLQQHQKRPFTGFIQNHNVQSSFFHAVRDYVGAVTESGAQTFYLESF